MARRRGKLVPLGRYIVSLIGEDDGAVGRLAEDAKLSANTVNAYMRGSISNPGVASLKQLADALKVPFQDLCQAAICVEMEPPTPERRLREAMLGELASLISGVREDQLPGLLAEVRRQFDEHQRRIGVPVLEPATTKTPGSEYLS